jgi:hypothetical protein
MEEIEPKITSPISEEEYRLALSLYQAGYTARALEIVPNGQGGSDEYGEDIPLP